MLFERVVLVLPPRGQADSSLREQVPRQQGHDDLAAQLQTQRGEHLDAGEDDEVATDVH